MISEYDLYDLRMIFIAIRSYPKDPINENVVSKIIEVLNVEFNGEDTNPFRKSLKSIESIGNKSIYNFVFSDSVYTYYSLPFLKDEEIRTFLITIFQEMLMVIKEGDQERIVDLADCLHNLPVILVENRYHVPKHYWKKLVKNYQKKYKTRNTRQSGDGFVIGKNE